MCPVELMGSHSVTPSTTPKSTAFMVSINRFMVSFLGDAVPGYVGAAAPNPAWGFHPQTPTSLRAGFKPHCLGELRSPSAKLYHTDHLHKTIVFGAEGFQRATGKPFGGAWGSAPYPSEFKILRAAHGDLRGHIGALSGLALLRFAFLHLLRLGIIRLNAHALH